MKIVIRVLIGFVFLILASAALVGFAYTNHMDQKFDRPKFQIHEDVLKADVELGKRIFMVRNGCVDCHGANLAGAKVMDDLAMGSIYGANITPFKLKSWTDEEIATAIRYGIHKEGRSLRFMPSFDYEGLSKGDLAAVIAFLRSVPEVEAENHENTFGPIARVLSVMNQMPVMFPARVVDQTKGFAEKPTEEVSVAFGRYLANSCIGCHGSEYKGGKIPGGDPSWPSAANIRLGNGGIWTEEKFKEMILTGISPTTQAALRPPMPIALLKQMNETEIKSLWMFLSSLQ